MVKIKRSKHNLKILIDTNVLFSAILFEKSQVAKAVFYANEKYEVYLSDQNIQELRTIIKRKVPRLLPEIEKLLARLSYEVIPAINTSTQTIRDIKDQPILNAAIANDLDIILTGDKDFLVLDLDRPKCMTVKEFLQKY